MTRQHPQPAPVNRAGRQHAQAKALSAAAAAAQAQQAATPTQPYDWAQDPIWTVPIPEWGDCSPDLQQRIRDTFAAAAIALAVRQIADTRGVSAARQLADWEVI